MIINNRIVLALKTVLLPCAVTLLPIFAYGQCNPLTTLYAENNGQDGIMFDITATVDVTVTGFDCNMGETVTPYNMEIYYKAGTHIGSEGNPSAWTLAGSANNVVGLGVDVATAIPIILSVPVLTGQTTAFYITETGGIANIDYTDGTAVGAVYVTDGNISVLEGTGKDYPFLTDYTPRIPNITVYYDCCPPPTLVETDNSCSGLPDGSIEATGMGTGPWIYELSDITGVLETSAPTNGPYTFNGLIEGQYTISAVDASGCTAAAQTILTTSSSLTINSVITDNLCFGGSTGAATITINGGTAPFDIAWTDAFGNVLLLDPASNGNSTLSNLAAGNYIITAVGQSGCSLASTLTVTEPGGPLVLTLTPENLTCFEQNDGEVEVSQNGSSPFAYQISDVFGVLVQAANNATDHTFQNLEAGIYFITVTDSDGCETTDNIEVFEPDVIAVETNTAPVLCFNGADGVVNITLITGGTLPFAPTIWDDPGSQTGNTASNLSSGDYIATVTDANGCTLDVAFQFVDPPQLTLIPSYLTDTCGQEKAAAVIQAQLGTPPYTYLWLEDSTTLSALYGIGVGSYEVEVTDVNGCMNSTSVDVQDDLPYPLADFEYRIEGETLLDREVQFINNSVATSQWTWNFGNGASANNRDPRHHYEKAGDYLVQLLGSNGFCIDTAYQYINIDPMLLIYIPNAFTPGINGINDSFYPQGEGIGEDSYDMFIYDRWGKEVWQTGNYGKQWDGTDRSTGKDVRMGTYYYLIKFREFADLDRHEYYGTVTVIRD